MHKTLLLFLLLLTCLSVQAASLPIDKVPPSLKPWVDWVLFDQTDYECPFWYGNYAKGCSWATSLSLDLNNQHGSFTGTWRLYRDDWITLPGEAKHWPQHVNVNEQTGLVQEHKGRPALKLSAGSYTINGEFLWEAIPESLQISATSALINLKISGKTVAYPAIKGGAIWLKESDIGQRKSENLQDKLDMQVFRQINDDVPLQLITYLVLEVSGQQREIKLPHILLPEFIPISLQSQLPVKIEIDGSLSVQIRPGRWRIELSARHPKPLTELGLTIKDSHWPKNEVWVFNAQPYQRLVEIEGLLTIDPSQTNLPEEWKRLPAYQVEQGETMKFKVIRRGDPEPEPNNLTLARKLWLDSDGKGYTIQDEIQGKLTNGWRLDALTETQLGQVKLNEENQLITQLPGTEQQGVEVRKGELALKADSRFTNDIRHMSAAGWQQSFRQVNTILNLPPGWRLLAVTGVDNDPDSWISRWTLLDLFLVLISGLAIGRLWNPYWGGFALVCLALTWHETEAPGFIWLNILSALALIRVLPPGKFLTAIQWYRNTCWVALIIIVVPFLVEQVRIGIYPQLEKPWQPITQAEFQQGSTESQVAQYPVSAPAAQAPMNSPEQDQTQSYEKEESSMTESKSAGQQLREAPVMRAMAKSDISDYLTSYSKKSVNFNRIDPNANVQTGQGAPKWQWNQVYLSWNGAVSSEQQVGFWYLGPTSTMLLNFVRVIMVFVLSLLMFNVSGRFKFTFSRHWVLGLCLLPLFGQPSADVYADEFPSRELLNELKNRLLEKPDCLPSCAQISRMDVKIDAESIILHLQAHVQKNVGIPLPAAYQQWFPQQVTVDGKVATAMLRDEQGQLWLQLDTGIHEVALVGSNPGKNKFTLPLPLKPRYVKVNATGWSVEGVHEDGVAEDQLQFNRIQESTAEQTTPHFEQGVLPAFLNIERTLELGLDWRLTTRISKVVMNDSTAVLEFPLLKGESVTTPDLRVKNGNVQVTISAHDSLFEWQSILEKTSQLELVAPETMQWTEIWRVDVSPIWNLETSGIAVVHHQDKQGHWLPEWRPWPGEKVTLLISRPEAISGRTLTIDNSELSLKPGKRSQEVNLTLTMRSSKGSQHTLKLPDNAILQSVLINGVTQPIRQKGTEVTLPIKPGKQQIVISWLQMTGLTTFFHSPLVNLGADSVNSHIEIGLGEDRWVLVTAGPRCGPAVLFWGILLVITLLSVGLGKVNLTPLKHWQWFLLLIGLSQIPVMAALVVISWLMALGLRARHAPENIPGFNRIQIALGILTLCSLTLLFVAVRQGLLSAPDMQIEGNQSSISALRWYQDRTGELLPTATVISVPLISYRLLMLTWSLWLAVSLLNWLKWGWTCFSSGGLWKKAEEKGKVLTVDSHPS